MRGYNPALLGTRCPSSGCGRENNFAQGIERRYGARAGRVAREVLSLGMPELASARIEAAVREVEGERVSVTAPFPIESVEAEYV